jgi:DNA polymerase-3 subunit delta'
MYKALNTSNIDADTLSDGLINLSDGSVGNAIRLSNYNALSIYKSIVEIVETFPNLNGNLAIALSEQASKKGDDQILNIIVELIELVISRLAYSGLGKLTEELIQNEKIILNSVSNTEKHAKSWADLVGKLRKKINYAITVNIDPGTLILDTLFTMNQTSQQLRLRNST